MKISKTLFKDFARCNNFSALYDMYQNRFLHQVKEIDGTPIVNNDVIEDISKLDNDLFSEEYDLKKEIFDYMFDEDDGHDLTVITNAQMEAFASIFTEVERLASIYISKLFNHEVIASTKTYEQKKYSYNFYGNTFYCYLDVYFEDEDSIKIFEVKSTTSKKYDEFILKVSKEEFPFFIKTNSGIMKYVGRTLEGMIAGKKTISIEQILKKETNLFNRFAKEGKYIYDIAVERHIIENSIKQSENPTNKKREYYLVVLNSEYHFDGKYDEFNNPIYDKDENGNELFKIYDMNFLTEEYQPVIEEERNQIIKEFEYLKLNTHLLGKHCDYKKTTQCKFCNICMKNVLKDGSILEYTGKHYAFYEEVDGKDKNIDQYEMINRGHYMITDCLPYLRKKDNIAQYNCYVNNDIYMDKDRISLALKSLEYPIYHLDFESYNSPLPRFRGEKPYDQSVFQYSLHKEISPGVCDLVQDHTEFLAKDHTDQRKALAKQLITDIDLSNGGCVMAYNKGFEQTRIKELASFFPEYRKELLNLNEHLVDLLHVLKGTSTFYDPILPYSMKEKLVNEPNFAYYHNNMHGSFSIKKILPLFTNLSYKDLVVKNGTEAIVTYGLLPTLTEKEYQEKYLALRVYCRQDTWAMVEILRGLRKSVEDEEKN